MDDYLGHPISVGDRVVFAHFGRRNLKSIDVGTVKFIDTNYVNVSSPHLPSAWRFPGEVVILTGTDINPTQITTTGEPTIG